MVGFRQEKLSGSSGIEVLSPSPVRAMDDENIKA
jgi:hypothetical protein